MVNACVKFLFSGVKFVTLNEIELNQKSISSSAIDVRVYKFLATLFIKKKCMWANICHLKNILRIKSVLFSKSIEIYVNISLKMIFDYNQKNPVK